MISSSFPQNIPDHIGKQFVNACQSIVNTSFTPTQCIRTLLAMHWLQTSHYRLSIITSCCERSKRRSWRCSPKSSSKRFSSPIRVVPFHWNERLENEERGQFESRFKARCKIRIEKDINILIKNRQKEKHLVNLNDKTIFQGFKHNFEGLKTLKINLKISNIF